ncbi:hypothetical protein C666_00040 [Thauera linaloolentis 47Lol = DSM 12138]|uniref:Secreted protein n=1 Tax=Thauera linaloolentis (strain DSM 12138 / JCM 21573 / CCUG 41526 / CIP 105981 / IAM 15112 / NBRC 102519 / 47Lol) TaxID=1123367 RepID=N6Z896_THAL4|nr:hypothetical protein C666_00040 [Thauera linaloolentis 47Lol = DSM 12138]
MNLRRGLFALAMLLAASAGAAPAPWHVWRSKLDGREFCAQTSPGPGWEPVRGPFSDPHCSKRAQAARDTSTVAPPQSIDSGQSSSRSPGKTSGAH